MEKPEKEEIVQNLKDAGCDEKTVEKVTGCLAEGRTEDGLKTLEEHRRALLEHVHEGQKCIDCLDYLVYQVKKEDSSNPARQPQREARTKEKGSAGQNDGSV